MAICKSMHPITSDLHTCTCTVYVVLKGNGATLASFITQYHDCTGVPM